ncbi:MAG: AMP-binding protein [Lachnospiraceae bacterium]|nr:AMP-binding protein [Lachnospiraceae bacterium]
MAPSWTEFADQPAVRWMVKKDMVERTYKDLDTARRKVWHALVKRGFLGKHISLIGTSSYPWIASYLALVSGRCTAVPLDAALNAEELVDLLNRSDSEALFLSPKLKELAPIIMESVPKLSLVIMLEEETGTTTEEKMITFGDLLAEGEDAPIVSEEEPDEDDVCTFIFTSGTTGKSKGVMLTQRNLYDNITNVYVTVHPNTNMLSVLPIHHAYCLVMDWMMGFSKGATLCINDSLLHMVRNIGKFEPDIMLMVPLMIETIFKRLQAAGDDVDKKEVGRKVFGKNLRTIYSGGAHLDPYYIDAMAEYGVEICEGYGMSECSPVISTNGELGNRPGSVGLPLPNAEVRIENGEVQVRGSSVMKGYYQMPKETEETLKDGWLHTGDLGRLDEDGYLYITGRLKNLIILSNGENISPEEIEGAFDLEPLVGEIVVTGEDNGLCARIYPDPEYLEAHPMSEDEVREALQALLDAYNKKQPTYKALVGLVVRQYPFLKSATKKIKRPLATVDAPEEPQG